MAKYHLIYEWTWALKDWKRRKVENTLMWIAWHIPRRLVMWCYVRMTVSGMDGNQHPDEVTYSQVMSRWGV